jgi:hypothetical protein
MTTLLAQIAPQRSTQYAALATTLAPYELQLCPLGAPIGTPAPLRLGGQTYLQFDLPAPPDARQRYELGALAMTNGYFLYHSEIQGQPGPFLQPIESGFTPAQPPELVEARRYRGKTNELLCHFLCNIARFSSRFANEPWSQLRVLDPLMGGGTMLFTALVLGAEAAAGVEQSEQDVKSTVAFLRDFTREARISTTVKEERLRRLGLRWNFSLGKIAPQRAIFSQGDTRRAQELIPAFKPHLIVTDLPYGIQHLGPLAELLGQALPVWAAMLLPGGVLAFSWDATRFPRAAMVEQVQAVSALLVRDAAPYNQLAHRVDRVIKQREILVAQRV